MNKPDKPIAAPQGAENTASDTEGHSQNGRPQAAYFAAQQRKEISSLICLTRGKKETKDGAAKKALEHPLVRDYFLSRIKIILGAAF